MKLARPLLGLAAAAAAVSIAVPSQAAGGKTLTLNFDDQYTTDATNSCTPVWVLTTAAPGDGNCANVLAGAKGNGFLTDDDYMSLPKVLSGKIDAARHLTGTIYIQQHGLLNTGTPADYIPGNIGADIAIKVNGVDVGTVSTDSVQPTGIAKVTVDLKLPASLNKKKLTSVEADVAYTSGVGLVGVSYAAPNQSQLLVPVK